MRFKLMLIDCDRTLLNDNGVVTERTKRALRNAVQNGVKVVFASGRAPGGIENVVRTISEDNIFEYFVCFNGGMIVKTKDGQVVSQSALTVNEVIQIADSISCDPENYYVMTSDRLVCQGYNKQAIIEAGKNGMRVTQGDVRLLNVEENIYKMVLAGDESWLNRMEQRLPEALRKQYNVTRSEPNNLEFVPLAASKGYALTILTDMLNISLQDTICFGDSENDISMIELAGVGVAMGNASKKLKAIADRVTETNNNDGLAKAIEELLQDRIPLL